MSESPSSPSDRRAQSVALLGFLLQAGSLATLLAISAWAKSDAIGAVARFLVVGLPIWLVLYLIFKQMQRVDAETLETDELRRSQEAGASSAIFEVGAEGLLLERSRLRWMIKWFLPSVTVILAIVLLVGHFLFWGWDLDSAFAEDTIKRTQNPTLMMWFVIGTGFFNYLYARYALTLSRLPDWRLMRSGATCMAGNALACLALAIALMAGTSIEWAEPLLAYIVRVVLILLGIEFTANFILDFYRPRTPDVVPRPSFESRMLSLIGEPGGIAKSIADAINYQFGFEVSSTWFYQLLQRWLFPIMVATIVVVLLLTSIVIVEPDEQVVIERFGRVVGDRGAAVLNPGISFKWPFPVDITYRAPAKRISELVVGEATEDEDHPDRAILWTVEHEFVPELMLLVAAPKDKTETSAKARDTVASADVADIGGESVAVSLLKVSVPIEYRIKNVRNYLFLFQDPRKILEAVAYQYLSEYAASVDMDQMIGPGREAFNRQFRERLQTRLDMPDLDLGIQIVFVGIRGAHPPAKGGVAKAFQEEVSAQTTKGAIINAAESEALKILTAVAGSKQRADEMDAAIVARDELRGAPNPDSQALKEAERRVQDLLVGNPVKGIAPLSGSAAELIEHAKARATDRVSEATNKVRAFATEVAAFEAAPDLYKQRKVLEVYDGIGDIRKFLIVGDPRDVITIYKTEEEGGLDRVLKNATKEK